MEITISEEHKKELAKLAAATGFNFMQIIAMLAKYGPQLFAIISQIITDFKAGSPLPPAPHGTTASV